MADLWKSWQAFFLELRQGLALIFHLGNQLALLTLMREKAFFGVLAIDKAGEVSGLSHARKTDLLGCGREGNEATCLVAPVRKDLPTRDLLLPVDLSGSMRQEDFTNAAGRKVDRLAAVKEVLGDFLVRREGDRVGLVVFGDAPFLQTPFSADLSLSRQLLNEAAIGMAGPRTAFGDAIGLGVTVVDWRKELNPPNQAAARQLLRSCREHNAANANTAWIKWRNALDVAVIHRHRALIPDRQPIRLFPHAWTRRFGGVGSIRLVYWR